MNKLLPLLIVFLLGSSNAIGQQLKELSLEDAIINRYRHLSPDRTQQLSWADSKDHYSFIKANTLYRKDTKGRTINSFSLAELNKTVNDSLQYFPRVKWISPQTISFEYKNDIVVYDIASKRIVQRLSIPTLGSNQDKSPSGEMIAYTKENNLYIQTPEGKEIAVSSDTLQDHVYGQAVSRFEFGIAKGTFWSPKSNYLAYYVKDESAVSDYPVVDYMSRVAMHTPVKYPMAGLPSEQVYLGIYNINTGKSIKIHPRQGEESYLTNITWSPDESKIYIHELNRAQNHMYLNSYDASTGRYISTLYEEKNSAFVEPQHTITFLQDGNYYLQSNRDGYTHVYLHKPNGNLIKQLTKGPWEVTEVLGFDKKNRNLYVVGTKDSPIERHIYKVDTKTGRTTKLSQGEGWHSASLSPDGKYIMDIYQSSEIPRIERIIDTNGKIKTTLLQSNDNASEYQFGKNEIVKLQSKAGDDLYGRLILPTNFDPAKKYPVIVYVYGGPHSQMVTKTWKNSARWWQYYMAQKGFISFTMDNHGTSARGRAFENAIHRNLGKIETEDQMVGIDYLKSLPYVDMDRIGVHGWSYGGFMTLNLMLRHNDIFKVGVAGGPVVDWSMYEIMYGERYMDTPEENPDGYEYSNMTNYVKNLNGKLMLIHGAQDDVVVMQHSMKFLRACVKEGKQVDFFTYPIHPHNVRGKDRLHLMEKVSQYFISNL